MGMGGEGNGKPSGVCEGGERWTWGGGGVPGGAGGSGSGGGGGWGWGSRTGGGGSEKSDRARGGRGSWTWGGGCGSRRGGSGTLKGPGGALGSESGASGWLRHGGGVGSVSAGGECAVGRGAGALQFAGLGLIAPVGPVRRCRRVLGGLVWCCLVLGGGGSPVLHGSAIQGCGGGSGLWYGWNDLPLGGFGPVGPLGVAVVAAGIQWLVRGGWPLVVGGVCGWSAR